MKLSDQLRQLDDFQHQEQVADLKRQVKNWKAATIEAQKSLGVALNIRKRTAVARAVYAKSSGASQSVAFLVGSDWHTEETVDADTVNGLNEFNLDIADRRIDRFFKGGMRLIEIQRTATDIDTCVLGLLGDHITGYIHEELLENNSMSPTETVIWLIPRIARGIDDLRKQFKRVVVVCCIGNHGRTTPKTRIATRYKNSFEWLMYHVLAQRYEGTNVQFQISNSYHNFFEVFGRTIRFHHGDDLKYNGGIGGITIPTNKKIAQWNKGRSAFLDVFGHFHQQFDGGNFICNGSLIGYGPYALSIGASPEPPQQTCFLIEAKRGKTIVMPVFLE